VKGGKYTTQLVEQFVFVLIQPKPNKTNANDMSCDSQARLSLDTQHKSLTEVVQQLSAKASLLDSAQLDHIEGRLTALAQKMDSINQKTAATPEDAERNQKVCSSSSADILLSLSPVTWDHKMRTNTISTQTVFVNTHIATSYHPILC
jgi:hypothetical protein